MADRKIDELQDIDQNICYKKTIKSAWQPSSASEVLSNRLPETVIFSAKEKLNIPVFGFNRRIGHTSNEQFFPTCFPVLELDVPGAWKRAIKEGDKAKFILAKAQTWLLYQQFCIDRTLPYYWMYLTPSTLGLRFVLCTDQPVVSALHYTQVVKQFLRLLYLRTNGRVNPDFFDIRVHQAWFVPTFEHFFNEKRRTFSISLFQTPLCEDKIRRKIGVKANFSPNSEEVLIQRAIQFTERNFSYLEGQRNKFVHHFACNCNRFGILQESVENWAIAQFDLEDREIFSAIFSAYRHNTAEFGKFLK